MTQVLCPVLIGQADARRALEDAVEAARRGAGHVTALFGDAGHGKSRLARAAVARAGTDGLTVLTGHATGERTPEPYRPLVEAVVGALRDTGAPTSERLRPFRRALGRFVPAWNESPPPEVPGVFVAEGFLTLLDVLGERRGTLLVVEDVHDADPETVDVLDHVAGALTGRNIAVLVTTRDRAWAERWARHGGEVVTVARLPADDTAAMARACLGGAELPPALPGLLARTDGIPLLVEEVLAAAIDRGVLARDVDGWTMRAEAVTAVPTTMAALVADRLAGLSPPAWRAVTAAALLGRHLDWTVLPPALGAEPPEVLRSLREASSAQLLVVADGGFRFRHALIADAVLDGLVHTERRDLAAALLAVLPRPPSGPDPEPWATLLDLADRPDDAADHLVAAGRHALAGGSLASARALAERALAVGRRTRPDALELLLDEAAESGDAERAERYGTHLLGRDGDARIRLVLTTAALAAGRWSTAAAHLGTVPDRGLSGPQRDRARALRAQVHLELGRLDEAARDAARAAAATDAETACRALEILGRHARLSDSGRARRWFDELLARAGDAELPMWRLRALHQLGTVQLRDTMDTTGLTRTREAADGLGLRARVATLDLEIGVNQAATLRPGDGVAAVECCLARARRDRLGVLPEALAVRAHLASLAGDDELARSCLLEVGEIGPDEELRSIVAARCHGLAALLAEDRARATACFADAMASVAGRPGALARPYFVLWPVLAELADLDADAARELVGARAAGVGCIAAGVGFAEAVAAGRRGDPEGAVRAFGRAEALLAPYGERFAGYHHLLRRLVAESALDHGWGTPGPWFREAAEHFRTTGHRAAEDACRAGLRATGAPLPRRYARPSTVPAGLRRLGVTEREAEVLALLADGRTNREVAEVLVISPRTVDKHVQRLLAKTHSPDRATLAVVAKVRGDAALDT